MFFSVFTNETVLFLWNTESQASKAFWLSTVSDRAIFNRHLLSVSTIYLISIDAIKLWQNYIQTSKDSDRIQWGKGLGMQWVYVLKTLGAMLITQRV